MANVARAAAKLARKIIRVSGKELAALTVRVTRMPLAELMEQLDAEVFWQIHRGTVVNMNEVASTRRDLGGRVFVKLKGGGAELPVSRAYVQKFKQM